MNKLLLAFGLVSLGFGALAAGNVCATPPVPMVWQFNPTFLIIGKLEKVSAESWRQTSDI